MTSEEQWKKNLDEAVLITTATELRHAKMIEDHRAWLESHTLAMLEHDRAMDKHDLAIEKHDEQMEEIRMALKDLTKRLGGGGNGHGQV